MSTAFADEAVRLRDDVQLTDVLLARGTGAARSTVRDWLGGRSNPTGVRAERLVELAEVVDRLGRVMRPEYIPVWLMRPIEALDDEKPVDVIGDGGFRRVARLVSALEDPGAV